MSANASPSEPPSDESDARMAALAAAWEAHVRDDPLQAARERAAASLSKTKSSARADAKTDATPAAAAINVPAVRTTTTTVAVPAKSATSRKICAPNSTRLPPLLKESTTRTLMGKIQATSANLKVRMRAPVV